MEPIIFIRKNKDEPSDGSAVIKVDKEIHNELVKINKETDLSIQKIASKLLRESLEYVKLIDKEDKIDQLIKRIAELENKLADVC